VAEERRGTAYGVACYLLWGLFPLYWPLLEPAGAVEILAHRVVWSLVFVLVVLAVQQNWGWIRPMLDDVAALTRLGIAAALIGGNWWLYIWAVNNEHVVEAALGYYINPLITVALGVFVLQEHLRRLQRWALGFGAASVAVLTVAYGRVPWVALVLAGSFATYGFLKKSVPVDATTSLAVETAVLVPFAAVAMAVLHQRGDAAFLAGSTGRDVLLVSLGVVTAVPLLLFGTAARRIPLSLLGLLQYLTPTMQLLVGVAVFHEPMPPERVAGFVLVWVALVLLGADALRTLRRTRVERAAVPVAEPA